MTIDQATQDKLLRAQALLRHRLPSGDLAAVLARALDALLEDLERERFAATKTPRAARARTTASDPRHVPHDVQRAVHARDGEQCTFVSEDGRRCNERGFLERDHVTPVALGGQPTTDGIRTMCKRHNAYEAERILGAEVVATGRRRRARTKAPTPAETATVAARPTPEHVLAADADADAVSALDADTFRALRTMRVAADDARDAIARSAQVRADTLEQRIRAALIALQATYASRCGESTLGWGWRLVATSAGHVGGRANGGHDSTAPRSSAA